MEIILHCVPVLGMPKTRTFISVDRVFTTRMYGPVNMPPKGVVCDTFFGGFNAMPRGFSAG